MMKTVIFLDIDGVLQTGSQFRFQHDRKSLMKRLANEKNDSHFLQLDEYDVGAVYYDWWLPAINYLHLLCNEMGAKIVLSSSWRKSKSLKDMKTLMSIHDLDTFLVDFTPVLPLPNSRANEIQQYLNNHPSIEKFVIIDDDFISDYQKKFPKKFVQTAIRLERKHFEQAFQILTQAQYPFFRQYSAKVIFLQLEILLQMENSVLEKFYHFLIQLCERFQASIVIPASWSSGYRWEELGDTLPVLTQQLNLLPYIVNVTPPNPHGLIDELYQYLKSAKNIAQFVIIGNGLADELADNFTDHRVDFAYGSDRDIWGQLEIMKSILLGETLNYEIKGAGYY